MKNKNFFLILGLVISTVLGGKVYASIESECAAEAGASNSMPEGITRSTKRALTAGQQSYFNTCVKEKYKLLEFEKNKPPLPGNIPNYNCASLDTPITQQAFAECKADHEAKLIQHKLAEEKYLKYMASAPNANVSQLSASQALEDIAAKLDRNSKKLQTLSNFLNYSGTALSALGTGLIIAGSIPIPNHPAIAKGFKIFFFGIALVGFGMVVKDKSERLQAEKSKACVQLNKIITKPISCDGVKEYTTIDGSFAATNYGLNGIGSTSDIPSFIDSKTGKCKEPVTSECSMIVKNSPKDCFKANAKGMSCMAGNKTKSPLTTLANGKVSVNLEGKQITFGAEDFKDEASMIKAGFSPAQAKQFMSVANDPNGFLMKNGVNAKGELKAGVGVIPTSTFITPNGSGSGGSSGAEGAGTMKSTKDEYGPVQEVARTPASAEGLTKDYHGDTIGAEGDNVFKMINRRYNLKQKQNIFIEQ